MRIIGVIAIGIIFFAMVFIIVREEKKKSQHVRIVLRNQQELEIQIKDWAEQYQPFIKYSEQDYMCPGRMHNGETNQFLDIECRNYTRCVPMACRK